MLISPNPLPKANPENFDSNFSGVIAYKRLEQPAKSIKEMSVEVVKKLVEEMQKETSSEESSLRKMINFVEEFGTFTASVESIFSAFSAGYQKNLDGQFREVKKVMTGVTISIEEIEEFSDERIQLMN